MEIQQFLKSHRCDELCRRSRTRDSGLSMFTNALRMFMVKLAEQNKKQAPCVCFFHLNTANYPLAFLFSHAGQILILGGNCMTWWQHYLLVLIDRFGFWCMRCGDIFMAYYVVDLLFPSLKNYGGYPFSGDIGFVIAIGGWMIAWLMLIIETGLKKHFLESA